MLKEIKCYTKIFIIIICLTIISIWPKQQQKNKRKELKFISVSLPTVILINLVDLLNKHKNSTLQSHPLSYFLEPQTPLNNVDF